MPCAIWTKQHQKYLGDKHLHVWELIKILRDVSKTFSLIYQGFKINKYQTACNFFKDFVHVYTDLHFHFLFWALVLWSISIKFYSITLLFLTKLSLIYINSVHIFKCNVLGLYFRILPRISMKSLLVLVSVPRNIINEIKWL